MEGALNRLAVHASLQESEITVDLVKDVLKDLLRRSKNDQLNCGKLNQIRKFL